MPSLPASFLKCASDPLLSSSSPLASIQAPSSLAVTVPFNWFGPFASSLSFMGREGISLSYLKTSSGSLCWVWRLQIPWPHLTQVLKAGLRRVWPCLLVSLPHHPTPSNPTHPVPFALQTESSWVLDLLSAESLLSAHKPHLRGAHASCSQRQADCPVKFPFLKKLWQIL